MRLRLIRSYAAKGFTLIELLLVLVILTALAAVVVPKFTGRAKEAQIARAKSDISSLGLALGAFEVDNGRYPSSSEGLDALRNQPGGLTNWKGPYIERPVGNDPWGNPYVYVCPGTHNTDGYDLHSFGPDGQDGTEDDIDNWTAAH
jgi:general secretion pathway protein G